MTPILEGVIARRVLMNYAADPDVVRRLVPRGFELSLREGLAVVGICLIRLEKMRPKGWPAAFGISMEGMAHRVAVQLQDGGARREGVFVLRRECDSALLARLGGRIFPGVHRRATFRAAEHENSIDIAVTTRSHQVDAEIHARPSVEWKASPLFPGLHDVSAFLRAGACGYSCALDPGLLEGMDLRVRRWEVQPLVVRCVRSAFFDNPVLFPPGAIRFDSALLMRGIACEWHPLPVIRETEPASSCQACRQVGVTRAECLSVQAKPESPKREQELIAK